MLVLTQMAMRIRMVMPYENEAKSAYYYSRKT